MLTLTTATTTYEAALLADAQARFDAMGVVIGETLVCDHAWPDISPFIASRLVADASAGCVQAWDDAEGTWINAAKLRPYVAPVVKEMVLTADRNAEMWMPYTNDGDHYRLTLSGITPADLDVMTGPITGTYTVEKL